LSYAYFGHQIMGKMKNVFWKRQIKTQ